MTGLERLMGEWLTDPDEQRRIHARNRIAIGFGPPDPADEQRRRADADATRARLELHRRVRACPEIDVHCGCDLPTCRAGRGDHDGGARTGLENCVQCLGLTRDVPSS